MTTPYNPESGRKQDGLVGHGLWLMAANFGSGFFNVLYQRVTSGLLSPGEYAGMQTLLTQLSFLILPFSALTTGMIYYTGRFQQEGRLHLVFCLVQRWMIRVMGIALAVSLFFYFFSGPLSDVFRLGRNTPFLPMCLTFAGLLALTVCSGTLQGLQMFKGLAWMVLVQSAGRVFFTWVILLYSFRAAGWAVLGNAIGYAAAVVVGLGCILVQLPRPDKSEGPVILDVPMTRFVSRSLIFLLSFQALNMADILIAKRLFTPERAGMFIQVSVLTRLVVWVAFPFARAMFPKVIADRDRSADHDELLLKTLGITLGVVLPVVGGVWLLPTFCFGIIFPSTPVTPELISVIRWMVTAMGFGSMLQVVLSFELAQNRARPLLPILVCAIAYLVAVPVMKPDVIELAQVVFTANLVALGCTLLTSWAGRAPEEMAAHA